jgi:wyosine [tRNA(Phe)-imidazoG37] synthetase (radical SAM superfamily)
MITYGPVPSRRLGRSVGINNIPPKACTYRCVYCQVGQTLDMKLERREFYRPVDVARDVGNRLAAVNRAGEQVDYLSFVPEGEPTLDINLGREIELLRAYSLPIAVITNGSLLTLPAVQLELATADWVSVKVDTVDPQTWRALNRPHRKLNLPDILAGITAFRQRFTGTFVTETMLVDAVNDTPRHAQATASFLARLAPDKAYVSVPTRPPVVSWVRQPSGDAIVAYHEELSDQVGNVEYLLGYEGSDFSVAGNPRESLLSITAVHPMRTEAVEQLLATSGADWTVVENLLNEGSLCEAVYNGHKYYLRALQWNVPAARSSQERR